MSGEFFPGFAGGLKQELEQDKDVPLITSCQSLIPMNFNTGGVDL